MKVNYLLGLFILFAAFVSCSGPDSLKESRPNIVILYADDMGYGDLGVQNPESKIPTPHLDKIAGQGLRLTDAHSSAAICTPSRYALLTGRYHWRKFTRIVQSFGASVFDDKEITLAELAKSVGYSTACIGKWHLGWDWEAVKRADIDEPDKNTGYSPDAFDWRKPIPDGPLSHGFDYYFGDDTPNFPPYTWYENDKVTIVPTEQITLGSSVQVQYHVRVGPKVAGWQFEKVMPTLTEKAVSWIRQQKSSQKPFLLYFPFTSPHSPIVPLEEFVGSSRAGLYGDFVTQTDWTVGQVLKALDDNGFTSNTIVIFTSDNGPAGTARKRILDYDHYSSGILRGFKGDIYEGGHRVPFLVRWPGKIKPGDVSDELFSQVDIFATLAGIIGADIPEDQAQDSYDQIALWMGTGPSKRGNIVYNHHKQYAIRSNDYVLLDNLGELYNLETDISQKNNLSDQFSERVKELHSLLIKIQDPAYSVR